jgi:uncharacterized protein (TIGR03435 family)
MVDKTGLGSKYFDVDLPWGRSSIGAAPIAPGMANKADDRDTKELFATRQKKLGLKVQLRTVPMEFIVIDHMDHVPAENS